ncbi:type-F conjugative transfer system pilin acetylase TraX [Scandinavium goeteborgense]|uniref:Type-F conjugative transfer system pilin acetylase TraX n=1 Tax=Scandinavium goeteborgense TaxID=1851514 RepID=A0A4R6E347_SCAGO|nr:type-F conjugative transfer system pilin acetylase TraX [Scandinavium goeteborgense]TDN51479.1 type-F conjugative transfer system pilin acetylase TraX [Scandinavium goeteborgense]
MANNPVLSLSPQARDWLKVIAFVAMVIDHSAIAFGWHETWMRMAGRVAMPIFALVWACNVTSHPVTPASLQKTWLWAALAQPLFFLALRTSGQDWYQLNILFLFAVWGQVLYATDRRTALTACFAFIAVAAYIPLSASSYGLRGMLLMAVSVGLFRVSPRHDALMLMAWLVTVFALNVPNGIPMALAGLCLTLIITALCSVLLHRHTRLYCTRWFAPAYALHLGLLFVLATVV